MILTLMSAYFVKFMVVMKILLGVCYRSPKSSADNDNNLLNLLNSMSRTKMDNIVIVENFNDNMIDWNLKSVTALSIYHPVQQLS